MVLWMGGNQTLSLGLSLFGLHLVYVMGALRFSSLCFSNMVEETREALRWKVCTLAGFCIVCNMVASVRGFTFS